MFLAFKEQKNFVALLLVFELLLPNVVMCSTDRALMETALVTAHHRSSHQQTHNPAHCQRILSRISTAIPMQSALP